MEMIIFGSIILLLVFFSGILIHQKHQEIVKIQNNHHVFLLRVKHDIPILHQRISELESQILPPEENQLN